MASAGVNASQASFLTDLNATQQTTTVAPAQTIKYQQQEQQLVNTQTHFLSTQPLKQFTAGVQQYQQQHQQQQHQQQQHQQQQQQFIGHNELVKIQSVQKPIQQFQTIVDRKQRSTVIPYHLMQNACVTNATLPATATRRIRFIKRTPNGINFINSNGNNGGTITMAGGNSSDSNDSSIIAMGQVKDVSMPQTFKFRANICAGWRRQMCDGEIVYFR